MHYVRPYSPKLDDRNAVHARAPEMQHELQYEIVTETTRDVAVPFGAVMYQRSTRRVPTSSVLGGVLG